MQRFRLITTLVLVISLLGIGVIGCSRSIPKVEDVSGKWVAIKKESYTYGGGQQVGFVIEFKTDYTAMLPFGEGTWTILKDGNLKIDIAGMTMLGSLQGDILTITMPDQKGKVIFKRQ
jgi:hypothetical protein